MKNDINNIIKSIAYCNLCLENPMMGMKEIIDEMKVNEGFENNLKSFGLSKDFLEYLYNSFNRKQRAAFDEMIFKWAMWKSIAIEDKGREAWDKEIEEFRRNIA